MDWASKKMQFELNKVLDGKPWRRKGIQDKYVYELNEVPNENLY